VQTTTTPAEIRGLVKDRYGALARCDVGSHQEATRDVAAAFGYSAEDLASIPAEANLGVSCGNPTALASLKPGEVVVDLGSGAGLDVFLAAPKVGPTGKAIGIDMTPDMIDRARKNAAKAGLSNIEFHLADITAMPLAPAPEPNLRIVGENKAPADPIAAQQAAVTKERPRELTITLNENVSMEFVLVPAGSF